MSINKNELIFQGFLKMAVIVSVLFGVNLFGYFGIEQPYWWTWCTTNKIYSCLLIFFVSNAIEGHFISTGAFEISLNGKICFTFFNFSVDYGIYLLLW